MSEPRKITLAHAAHEPNSVFAADRPIFAALLMTGSSGCFALMAASARWASDYVASPLVVLARGLVVLLPLVILMRARAVPLWGGQSMLLHLRGLLGTLALNGYYFALSRAPFAEVVVLANTAPLYVPVLGWLVLGEIPRAALVPILLVGFGGVVAIASPAGATLSVGLLAAASTGLFAAASIVCVRRLNRTEHPLTIVFAFTIWSTVTALPWLFGADAAPSSTAWIPLVLTGVFALVGQILVTVALRHSAAALVTVFMNVGPVMSLVLGWFLFDEWPAGAALGGAALIIGACTVTTRYAGRLMRPAPAA